MDIKFEAIVTDNVNIRISPNIDSQVVGHLKAGEKFSVEDIKQDSTGCSWYKSSTGFVCSKFCKINRIDKSLKLNFVSEYDDSISSKKGIDIVSGLTNTLSNTLDQALSGVMSNVFGSDNDYLSLFKRRIFGSPYQFLGTTDIRPDPDNPNLGIGRMYATNILREAPILSIMPVKPNYLPGLSNEEKTQLTKSLLETISESNTDLMKYVSQQVIDDVETRYFTTDIDHVDYMRYVNLLCRGAALFMGLGDEKVPGTEIEYKRYDWTRWRMQNVFGQSTDIMDDVNKNDGTLLGTIESVAESGKKKLEEMGRSIERSWDENNSLTGMGQQLLNDPDFMDKISTEQYYVDFYVTPSTSYSETFSNRTEQSAFANMLNKGTDFLKEIVFAMGANAIDSSVMQENLASVSKNMREVLQRINNGRDGLFSRLLMDAQTIISGSNIIFPEIYHDSERSQNYHAEIKLKSPYGSKESIFLNTLVPMFHILAFTLPKQTSVNSYGPPFLIKAHINKWFSCEMGIIDSCEIQKGGWNVDGFPSEITISLSFKDLYSALSMSKFDTVQNAFRFAMNQSLLEYLSVLCGLNLKVSEFETKARMLRALAQNMPNDYVTDIGAEIGQSVANAGIRILGQFGGGRV